MDNQHKLITGYRDLSRDEIDLMNMVKEVGTECKEIVERLQNEPDTDKRWVAIAQTDLQKGIMAAVRAVARPESF